MLNTEGLRVSFDRAKRERLRKAYRKAIKAKQEQFEFDGHQYLVRYAGYLLEYLDRKL